MKKHAFIPLAEPDLTGNEIKYLNQCINSSWISSKGEFINKFEDSFAAFIGSKYAISTSNGTTALHLALVSLGIGKGDEVIVPDLTFIATANSVVYTGARPVLVDVERETCNIDPNKIVIKITKNTRAILVVHLYGYPANMKKILEIGQKYNLKIIEDAAEAHGARINIEPRTKYQGHWPMVGSIGDVGCFSFYGNKIITTGEGGMIVTNNKAVADKIRLLRDHGQDKVKRYYHKVIGYNYRMTNMQAAVGLAQLERINEFIKKKREIAELYNKLLKGVPGLILPTETKLAKNVYWMYCLIIDLPYPKTRDQLIKILDKENIETRPFFYPLHVLPPYRTSGDFNTASYLSKHGINLPSAVTIKEKDIVKVTNIIRRYAT